MRAIHHCVLGPLRPGTEQGVAVAVARVRDLLVRLQWARLRNTLLAHIHSSKGFTFVYADITDGAKIRVYEVLTPKWYALFSDRRRAASQHDINVWYIKCAICGRPKKGVRLIYFARCRMSGSSRMLEIIWIISIPAFLMRVTRIALILLWLKEISTITGSASLLLNGLLSTRS